MSKTTEVYEDNAGGISIYHSVDDTVVWSMHYYGNEEDAAADFVGLAVQKLDPIAEGWDNGELDITNEAGDLIASTDWYKGSDDDYFCDPTYLGVAGKMVYNCIFVKDNKD